MFRKLQSAASNILGLENPNLRTLVSMGFNPNEAENALAATNNNVEAAAELLLSSSQKQNDDDDNDMHLAVQASLQESSQQRRNRTAAMNKAAEAAAWRAEADKAKRAPIKKIASLPVTTRSQQKQMFINGTDAGFSKHHPDVKVLPKLSDKTKEEQILRCADRLKNSYEAVDRLHRALTAIQNNPDNENIRNINRMATGYQKTLANAPGAEDLLKAMNFRQVGQERLVLDRHMVDPALLYLGISSLEQTQLTLEYQRGKQQAVFALEVRAIRASDSEQEAVKRAAFLSKIPSEPSVGSGALMQVVLAEETIRRRFDGDDTLQDVLYWLAAHGTAILEKIESKEWSLTDTNRYPIAVIDFQCNRHNTLQYIGCWPSGRLEVVPRQEEWQSVQPGSSRGLGAAPSDVL